MYKCNALKTVKPAINSASCPIMNQLRFIIGITPKVDNKTLTKNILKTTLSFFNFDKKQARVFLRWVNY